MEPDERLQKVLEEIRDIEREHLSEYRRVTKESLEMQRQAGQRQQSLGRIYTRMAGVGAGLIVVLMALLLYLLVRWSHQLFR
jgi:hypothetical protein